MQAGMLYHYLRDKHSDAYFEQRVFTLAGDIDIPGFEKSLRLLIQRYDVLRTIFRYETVKEPVQVVLRERNFYLQVEDISHLDEPGMFAYMEDFKRKDREKGFDLSRDMLIRVSLFKTGKQAYKLVWSFHHILMDGWCLGIVFQDFFRNYQALRAGQPPALEAAAPYNRYLKWLENQDKEQGLRYWEKYLRVFEEQTPMPGKIKNRDTSEYKDQNYTFFLDKELTLDLNQLAGKHQVTLNTLFQVVWGILLQCYNNCHDVVFGAVVSGRPPGIKGIERMVGIFINTIPVRVTGEDGMRFFQLLRKMQQEALLTKRYEYLPLAEIMTKSCLKGNLIDHIMVFENLPFQQQVNHLSRHQDPGFHILNVETYERSNYYFNILIRPSEEGIVVTLKFNSLAYPEEFVKQAAAHLQNLLRQVKDKPNIEVKKISLLTEQEKEQLLEDFNRAAVYERGDKSLQQLFVEQVGRTPDQVALVGQIPDPPSQTAPKASITYRELNRKSAQIAQILIKKGVTPDSIVGIMIDRSVEMMVGILGILKAGGAYLPLYSGYPPERIKFMLKDSGARLLVTQESYISSVEKEVDIIDINNIYSPGISGEGQTNGNPGHLAYVIYTSGTTGKPKGTLTMHHNVTRVVKNTNYIEFTKSDRVLQLSNYAFDGSVFDIYGALLNGAVLVMLREGEVLAIDQLSRSIQMENITVFFVTTALFNILIDEASWCLTGIRRVLFGGEKVSVEHCQRALNYLGNDKILHVYGPTETTVYATYYPINRIEENSDTIPIGTPISDTTLYVLDKELRLVPVGIAGQLYIGGGGVARGYLNRPELTAEKFIKGEGNFDMSYIYKTGDLVRWLPDGNIVFLGRVDRQVKIRGFRIELEEIEQRLINHHSIKEAIIIVRKKERDNSLCAYFVPVSPGAVTVSELKDWLAAGLADYMVPAYFVPLDALPLTPNGKIDSKALPEPGSAVVSSDNTPGNEVEKILLEVWQEVLGLKNIGVTDNFFEIGGDSIKAIQVSSRLLKSGLKLDIRDLFANQTIRQTAKTIKTPDRKVLQEVVTGSVPLTPIQHWFFENHPVGNHHFNQAVMLFKKDGFDTVLLKKVFKKLVEHHDALRMVYKKQGDGPPLQINRGIEEPLFDLEIEDLHDTDKKETGARVQALANQLQESIDLEKGPLVKVGLFKTSEGDHLLIAVHHLVVDGVSWRILLEDFSFGYLQVEKGEEIKFQDKTDSFQHWAHRLSQYAESNEALTELAYWQAVAGTVVEPLPLDHQITDREKTRQYIETMSLQLDKEETGKLLTRVNQAYNTEINDILLTALGLALNQWAGMERILVNLEGHGREPIMEDVNINRTVGWFTSMYPVVLEVNLSWDLSLQLKYIKETLRKIPNKGIGYGILTYLTPPGKKEKKVLACGHGISFNYMGQFGQEQGDQGGDEALVKISPISAGRSTGAQLEQTCSLTINGILMGEHLGLLFAYNKNEFEANTIERLLDCYHRQLKQIITHCSQREYREFTPSDLTYDRLSLETVQQLNRQYPLEDIYPLSPMQQGFLYQYLYDKDADSYIVGASFRIEGSFKPALMEKSFNKIVQRYDILRTVFKTDLADIPLQLVKQTGKINYDYQDISQVPEQEKDSLVAVVKEKTRAGKFDLLSDEPLMLLRIIKLADKEYEIIWHHHHILMDGWCLNILFKEILTIYSHYEKGNLLQLPPVVPYKNYIKWLGNQDPNAARDYWQHYLDGYEECVSLPGKQPGTQRAAKMEAFVEFTLEPGAAAALQKIAGKRNGTLYNVIQALWSILLFKYSGRNDAVFGQVVSGRPESVAGVESMVGVFINTLPKRVTLPGNQTMGQLIEMIAMDEARTLEYHYYPLAEILSLNPLKAGLFNHIMVFENQYQLMDVEAETLDIDFKVIPTGGYNPDQYDLTLFFIYETGLKCVMRFDGNVYQQERVRDAARHFKHIVGQILEDADREVSGLSLLTADERRQLLQDWNRTQTAYPGNKTIDQLFREQMEKNRHHIAVNFEDAALTYQYLEQQANDLAHFLIASHRVLPEEPVAIMMEPSELALVGILGILKAGTVYVPIDPRYPVGRISYILTDSSARILLTTTGLFEESKIGTGQDRKNLEIIFLNSTYLAESHLPPLPRFPASHPLNLAYIIYTSGSTGYPKGVMVEHRNVVRLVKNTKYIRFIEGDRVLQTGALEFDASTFEVWGALLNGLRLLPAGKNQLLAPQKLREIIETRGITIMWMTAPFFNQMVDNDVEIFAGLRCLLVGGDALSPVHINKARKRFPQLQVINGYGPTENTTFSTTHLIRREYPSNIPIGRPISNSTAYIVDKNSQPVPVGVRGELWVGGDGVARGYLNNPQSTREQFINNPFGRGRVYRTGDLVEWQSSGDISFFGRKDQQVKIRGYRIETGEIETRLLQYENISKAVVAVRKDENQEKYLCAYIVPSQLENHGTLNPVELREFLADKLPDYMIPAYFVSIEKIPLTTNGKVDWKALPDPRLKISGEYTPPADEIEKKLAELWSETLGIEKKMIGREADFFELGGHSLKATTLISKIHKAFEVNIPLLEIFTNPTLKELSSSIKTREKESFVSIEKTEEKEYYPMSSAQRRFYLLQQVDLESPTYNTPLVVELEGNLADDKLEDTFNRLIRRHESFRTSFVIVNDQPVQKIDRETNFQVNCYETDEAHANQLIETLMKSFSLDRAPLLRVGLIKIEKQRSILAVNMHHIISDGTTMGILMKEFMALYHGEPLPPVHLQYKDFSEWQTRMITSGRLKQQETFWLKELAGEPPVLELPLDYERSGVQGFAGKTLGFWLGEEETAGLKILAANEEATLYMVLLAILNVLLAKLCGQEDIIIGAGLAGRRHADLQQVTGVFINTLAMRSFPAHHLAFRSFLKDLRKRVLNAFENQDYPFDDLVARLKLTTPKGRAPLFDIMFDVQNMDIPKFEADGITLKPRGYETKLARFDMTILATEMRKDVYFTIEYSTGLYKQETIDYFIGYFKQIVSVVIENPGKNINQIEILPGKEKQRILNRFNDTTTEYPRSKCLSLLIEEQVERVPDGIALIAPPEPGTGLFLTYKEFNREANRLAHLVREKGIQPDNIAAVTVQQSVKQMIALLAVLKAGAAYLPLPADYPSERKRYMLQDSGARLLLMQGTNAGPGEYYPGITAIDIEETDSRQTGNLEPISRGNHLAYVIYTSGSTGKPKGTLITHANVTRVVKNTNYITITGDDRVLQFSNYAFDGSVFDIFGALLNGATLVMIKKEDKLSMDKLSSLIRREKITVYFLTTAFFNTLVDVSLECLTGIRKILFGGEMVSMAHARKALRRLGANKIIHVYGPTESTVYATYYFMNHIGENDITIPIGKPLANTTAYIIGQSRELLPIGVLGELCLGGEGLARGYLNNPELTRDKFIKNPFVPGDILYRTGDLTRWLPDGNIEFRGRIDQQVKIRGFRIEPGEIENKLLMIKGIKEAVVIPVEPGVKSQGEYEGGERDLCAYIAADRQFSVSQLREYLLKRLPDYMVPSYFVFLDKIPLNDSGKVDRKALPAAELADGQEYRPPRDEVEAKLANLWAEVLGVNQAVISIDADFFEIGGHSLKAAILAARVHKTFNTRVPLGEIFHSPTIKQLACYIKNAAADMHIDIEPVEEKEYYPTSSAQKRLYALQRVEPGSIAYNMPQMLRLEFEMDKKKLEQTFKLLMARHESLRTSFEMINEQPVQRVHNAHAVPFRVDFHQTGEPQAQTIAADFVKPFDLTKTPLFRVGLINTGSQKHILMLDLHHIISDGVSMEIFLRDFKALYAGTRLPGLKLQYKDYSQWQNRLFQSQEIKKQENYWHSRFKDETPILNLPVDYPRNIESQQSFAGERIHVALGKALTDRFRHLAAKEDVTSYMLLLAVLNILMSKYTDQEDIIVGCPIFGRKHDDLQHIIGMFVNMLAMRNQPKRNKTFNRFLEEVKKNAMDAYENQEYQFEHLVEHIARTKKRDITRCPLVEVILALDDARENPGEQLGIEMSSSPSSQVKPYEFQHQIAKFDLTVAAVEMNDDVALYFEYRTGLFKQGTIERMGKHLVKILEMVVENRDVTLADINLLETTEKDRIINSLRNSNDSENVEHVSSTSGNTLEIGAEFDW